MKLIQWKNLILLAPAIFLSIFVGNAIGTIDFSETNPKMLCPNNPFKYELPCERFLPIIDYDVNLIPPGGIEPGIELIPTSTDHQIILLNK